MVAMIPVETCERLVAEREARFAVLERIRARPPEVSPEEVERDVAEAVAAVRAARGPLDCLPGSTGDASALSDCAEFPEGLESDGKGGRK